jgi:molecular chaperone GrpE (heat shock protein)
MDKEHEIPVKVVDRRWWANKAETGNDDGAAKLAKPTYVEELEQQVADKDRLVQEYIAKYRQASSDFEEARIRLRKEIGKDVERARRDVLSEILEVVDNLDRAIDASAQASSVESVLQGLDLVRRQFLAKLEGLGVTRIDTAAQPFDPALHEAITTVPADSPEQDGLVVGIVRHGYRIQNDVLRPAAVAVAKSQD